MRIYQRFEAQEGIDGIIRAVVRGHEVISDNRAQPPVDLGNRFALERNPALHDAVHQFDGGVGHELVHAE